MYDRKGITMCPEHIEAEENNLGNGKKEVSSAFEVKAGKGRKGSNGPIYPAKPVAAPASRDKIMSQDNTNQSHPSAGAGSRSIQTGPEISGVKVPGGEPPTSQEEGVGALAPDRKKPPEKTVFTLEEVSNHCEPHSCWVVLWDHVYDVTNFIREHPGGEDIIFEHGGRDATFAFRDVGHSSDALVLVTQYQIGVLVEHERIFKQKKMDSCST